MRYNISKLLTIAALAGLCLPAAAQAQTADFQVEQFEPQAAQGINLLNMARSQTLGHLTPSAGLFLHYINEPIAFEGDGEKSALISDQFKAEALLGFGFFDILDVSLAVPVVLYQGSDDVEDLGFDSINAFALSDMRITPKVTLIRPEWAGGFGAAILGTVYLPTGDDESFNSDGSVRFEPRLAVDWGHESGFAVVANAGFQLRPERGARNFASGNTLKWGAGLQIPVGYDPIKIIGSVFGAASLADADGFEGDEAGTPIEALGAVQWSLPANLVAQLGAGSGLNDSVGSPALRVFASLSYTPMGPKDSDGDGILDADDACPDVPGLAELDGCPAVDTDGDGISDHLDACPQEAGLGELDGCPPGDADGDGIADHVDACPDVAGVPEHDGCPEPDRDGDGIVDSRDKCPDEAGIPELDGCPAVDTDGDGIADHLDKCPDEPGVAMLDGCPQQEEGITVTETQIEVSETVYFDTGKATIQQRSFDLLDKLVRVLDSNPKITGVLIEGHTDDVGKEASNQALSKARAQSVLDYFVSKGIASERLTAEGFGESRPRASIEGLRGADLREARSQNRRVEFKITEVDGEPIEPSTSAVTVEESE